MSWSYSNHNWTLNLDEQKYQDHPSPVLITHNFYENYHSNNGYWMSFESSLGCNCVDPDMHMLLFSVTDPSRLLNSWDEVNKWFEYSTGTRSRNLKNPSVGHMSQYILWDERCTEELMNTANTFEKHYYKDSNGNNNNNNNSNNNITNDYYYEEELKHHVFQFESSHFRYCLLNGNVRKIRVYNNKFGSSVDYFVFPFGAHRDNETQLFGLGQMIVDMRPNNKYNKNKHKHNNCNNNNKNSQNKPPIAPITRLICDINSNGSTINIYTKSDLIDFFQQFGDFNINNNGDFEKRILPQPVKYTIPCPQFDKTLEIIDIDKVIRNVLTQMSKKAERERQQQHVQQRLRASRQCHVQLPPPRAGPRARAQGKKK